MFGVLWLDTAFVDGCGLTHVVRSDCWVGVEVFSVMGGFWWVAGRGRRADTCRKAESSLSSPKGWLVVFAVCDAERVGPFFSRSLRVARCLEIVII